MIKTLHQCRCVLSSSFTKPSGNMPHASYCTHIKIIMHKTLNMHKIKYTICHCISIPDTNAYLIRLQLVHYIDRGHVINKYNYKHISTNKVLTANKRLFSCARTSSVFEQCCLIQPLLPQ